MEWLFSIIYWIMAIVDLVVFVILILGVIIAIEDRGSDKKFLDGFDLTLKIWLYSMAITALAKYLMS